MMKETNKNRLLNSLRMTTALIAAVLLQTIIFGTATQAQPGRNNAAGAVFAMTNATEGNEIITYARASDGTLTRLNEVEKTRGLGQGVDTDTQGQMRELPRRRSRSRRRGALGP